jgi:hypothetical protein
MFFIKSNVRVILKSSWRTLSCSISWLARSSWTFSVYLRTKSTISQFKYCFLLFNLSPILTFHIFLMKSWEYFFFFNRLLLINWLPFFWWSSHWVLWFFSNWTIDIWLECTISQLKLSFLKFKLLYFIFL